MAKLLAPLYLVLTTLLCAIMYFTLDDISPLMFFVIYFLVTRILLIPGLCKKNSGKVKWTHFIPVWQGVYFLNPVIFAIHISLLVVSGLSILTFFIDPTPVITILRFTSIPLLLADNIIYGIGTQKQLAKGKTTSAENTVKFVSRILLFIPGVRFLVLGNLGGKK